MDREISNCNLHISDCCRGNRPAEGPRLLGDVNITSLEHLVQELHVLFANDHVHVQDVKKLMNSYVSNEEDWKQYSKFDRLKYTRNLVDKGNGKFNIIILCWGSSHESAIHDHADSHCFMKILKGKLREVRFEWPDNVAPTALRDAEQEGGINREGGDAIRGEEEEFQQMRETMRTDLLENDVCYINDTIGLHRMQNPSDVDGAVSLHLYCPPFDSCRVFDGQTSKTTVVPVTFWSEYGVKVKQCEGKTLCDPSK